MKRTRLWISLMLVGLSYTQQVKAGLIEMGGFQIQVEQKGDAGVGIEEPPEEKDDRGGQGWTPPVQTETPPVAEGQTETPEPSSWEWEPLPEEEPVAGEETDTRVPAQQADGTVGEDIGLMPAEPPIEIPVPEGSVQETAKVLQEEQEVERVAQQEGQALEGGQETDGDKTEGQEIEDKRPEGTETEKKKTEDGKIGDKEKKEKRRIKDRIRFVHEDLSRLSDTGSLAVRLEGEQEVCVLSCAVNRKECAYRWEKGCMIPVDTFLQKGMNCLEIVVLLPDGQVLSMDPWYFSCGVGLAVL